MPVSAFADQTLVDRIAGCAGRLSAEVEHAWLVQSDDIVLLERQRDSLRSILTALSQHTGADAPLPMVIDAKFAHAGLLRATAFATNPKRRKMAKQQAWVARVACQHLLLDS
ncbi:MAG: hypothetical protein AAF307_12350 [Pseudomonadota bacterium]